MNKLPVEYESSNEFSAARWRRYCGLDGRVHDVEVYRWNRQLVARLPLHFCLPIFDEPPEPLAPSAEFLNKICYELTARQRQVFLTCLETPSYSEAGRRLEISHVAIGDFLKRMSVRNHYVRAFRETRQR